MLWVWWTRTANLIYCCLEIVSINNKILIDEVGIWKIFYYREENEATNSDNVIYDILLGGSGMI